MTGTTTQQEAIELLAADHADVEQMLLHLEAAPKGETRDGMAPTHPHPKAPNTPPGNAVGGAAAAIGRARDALRRS